MAKPILNVLYKGAWIHLDQFPFFLKLWPFIYSKSQPDREDIIEWVGVEETLKNI